jgi:hypothetical protein
MAKRVGDPSSACVSGVGWRCVAVPASRGVRERVPREEGRVARRDSGKTHGPPRCNGGNGKGAMVRTSITRTNPHSLKRPTEPRWSGVLGRASHEGGVAEMCVRCVSGIPAPSNRYVNVQVQKLAPVTYPNPHAKTRGLEKSASVLVTQGRDRYAKRLWIRIAWP